MLLPGTRMTNPDINTSEVQYMNSGLRGVLRPERNNLIKINKDYEGKYTHRCYLSKGDSGHTDHPRTNLGPQGIVTAICLFMVFAPALQVKGTGKG